MSAAKIREVLERYGESYDTRKGGTVWEVQGTPVISHKCLERIAARAGVQYDMPTILRCERDEAVILVAGTLGERREWSIGEALVNVNYRVSGKQAAYVFAMAEKRVKDRVILKLVELHGLAYSEEEADEFKQDRPARSGDPGDRAQYFIDQDEEAAAAARLFIADCERAIDTEQSRASLLGWWNSDERKADFKRHLTPDEGRALADRVTARAEALKPRAVS
jgi:hypothetical protein